MVLINVLVFVVLKILHNPVFVQNSFFASNCWRKQNSKSTQGDIALNVLSETVNIFA